MQLFEEGGYEQTTVADIADRAGVTSRTFFRYFADKREVLFGGSDALREAMTAAVLAAPTHLEPLEVMAQSLNAAADMIGGQRGFSRQRYDVINANAALRERELTKMATLSAALGESLRSRGVAEPAASLAAEAGIAVFRVGFEQWVIAPQDRELRDVLRAAFTGLRELR